MKESGTEMKTVDARRLACPQPVILTKKALDEGDFDELITIVDNATALENVKKLAQSKGCEFMVKEKQGEYYIHIKKICSEAEEISMDQRDTVILISSNLFGKGDEQLGQVLMKSFMYTLTQLEGKIKSLIFINSGVFLTTEGSEVIDHLIAIQNREVKILSCGTCLDFYGLKEKLLVGNVSNMYTIVEQLTTAAKTITL